MSVKWVINSRRENKLFFRRKFSFSVVGIYIIKGFLEIVIILRKIWEFKKRNGGSRIVWK